MDRLVNPVNPGIDREAGVELPAAAAQSAGAAAVTSSGAGEKLKYALSRCQLRAFPRRHRKG
jgi:hypothetical protein